MRRSTQETTMQSGKIGLKAVSFMFFLLTGLVSGSIGHSLAEPQRPEVVHITSDRLEALQQARQVVFTGHVVATQGDLTIQGDRMTIFYLEGNPTEAETEGLSERVDRIVVEGNVRISQGNRLATGERATYFRSDNKVVLTGEPRVYRDKDSIQGDRITLFLDSEKSIVEGGHSGPVEATLFSSPARGSLKESKGQGGGSSAVHRDEGG